MGVLILEPGLGGRLFLQLPTYSTKLRSRHFDRMR